MIVIPAIDLKEGKCVRLVQGDFKRGKVYAHDPVTVAKRWCAEGANRLHIVDLDGSLYGKPLHREVIAAIVREVNVPVQVGGGIRDRETIAQYLSLGVKWVILGTAALGDGEFIKEVAETYPGRIILAVDAAEGRVAIKGWQELSTMTPVELVERFKDLPLSSVIYTDIKRDGTQRGVNIEATQKLAARSPFPVIASGGVGSITDIERLREVCPNILGVIVGRALYEGVLNLAEAIRMTQKAEERG